MWQLITAGFILGLVSSLHCIGMCGPLALALPVQHLGKRQQALAILLYNAGRVITYSLLGLLFGLAGRRIYVAGFQQWFSIALGTAMLLFTARYFFFNITTRLKWADNFNIAFQRRLGRFFQPSKTGGYIVPGLINGLLPCGMVYLAIAGAVSTTQVSHSLWFMFFFGIGTWPAMLALSLFGARIKFSVRQQLKTAMPYLVAVVATMLILRGMQLGIPFISPILPAATGEAVSCHQ
jgi:sulfite exporter TauE/SafE